MPQIITSLSQIFSEAQWGAAGPNDAVCLCACVCRKVEWRNAVQGLGQRVLEGSGNLMADLHIGLLLLFSSLDFGLHRKNYSFKC